MEDKRIIDLYFKRDESAIAETAFKYGGLVRSIARNILRSDADAEECENDVYNAAWNAIPPERPENFSAFLGRITRNIALDRYDYNTAAKRNGSFDLILSELEECISSRETTESEYEQKLIAEYIDKFLRQLDYTKRVVFIRRYWYADGIRDISDRYGYSESKVKSMLSRCRKQLKKYLERNGITL
ncbi:MAG TPA: sigma-70 family RNA polymerase sigma factor [Firmicutes bacterium]|nr:sigma-70 family RNA polymerase sigma factor [Bacillota bacterium]